MGNELATRQHGDLASPPGTPSGSLAMTTPTSELIEMAKLVAAAHLIPGVDTAPAAFTLMLICQAQGLHPGEALTRFHIIHNRPVMRADAMQAEFQRRGGIIRWLEWTREVCRAVYLHPTHAPDPGIEITTTLAEMMKSGEAMQWDKEAPNGKGGKGALVLKDNYRSMPHKMLRARNISEGVRMVLPGVVVGIYTPEEVGDLPLQPAPQRQVGREPRVVQARVIDQPSGPSNGPSNGSGDGGIIAPTVVDPEFRAKVSAAAGLPGIVRAGDQGQGSGPAPSVDYSEPTDPIRDDQKQQLRHLVQEVIKLSPDQWQAMLLPYHATKMGDLTAIEAAEIIRSLEVRADGDIFGGSRASQQEEEVADLRARELRSRKIAKVIELADGLGWDDVQVAGYCGRKVGLIDADDQLLDDLIADLQGQIGIAQAQPEEPEIPDTTRPYPKRPRKPKKEKEDQPDTETAATEPAPATPATA